ncbi:tRNA N(3)-methylcytidine methyltransferase METTL2-like [Colius striatus]|uniref:tRNA N(3)-methylcytidine methyltransferase METTL2-like n=1 Tax=Colius striatus TaxID=57412 RepID=UPI002B1CEAF4|nr:tRNA N(3)-methylcytidine methyltransferase METTL2-like [Colius striatus]
MQGFYLQDNPLSGRTGGATLPLSLAPSWRRPERRRPFGKRLLTDPARHFQYNAWDHVEWSEEQEANARSKVQENRSQLLPQDKQEEYEVNAKRYWDDFYQIHENGFFKDRHWLFTEFPGLAPQRNTSQKKDSVHEFNSKEESSIEGLRSCENGHCSLETKAEDQFNLMKSTPESCREELALQKCNELKGNDGDYPGSSASYCVLENNAEYDSSRCFAFIHDLCNDQSPFPMPDESLDVVILIFVLLAIHPEKTQWRHFYYKRERAVNPCCGKQQNQVNVSQLTSM